MKYINLYTIYKNGIIIYCSRHEVLANIFYEYYNLRYNKDIVSFETIHDVDNMYPGLQDKRIKSLNRQIYEVG